MIRKICFLSLIVLFVTGTLIAGSIRDDIPKRHGKITRITESPKIDGLSDDKCWSESETFEDFIQYEPFGGSPSSFKTVVKIVYDDEAVYVCAVMYDPHPDSIKTELGQRDADRSIVADYFTIDLSPYNDGLNGYSFKLSASGVQTDIKRSGAGGRDLNWDAVWQSAVSINSLGWVAEIKIPFSAVRFPVNSDGKWGANFWRFVQRKGEWSSWNFADKTYGTTINYLGNIDGFSDIRPPARISVTPYLSAYSENDPVKGKWTNVFNGGADLKIGLSESFTLDATLIPDFKQVRSDDQVLNLTPFEIKYNEKRQFFTEGADVFGKADIFYSRRVGGRPTGYSNTYNSLYGDEEVVANPLATRVLNAAKVSGRTKKGLGIGFFNAITAPAESEIFNPADSSTRYLNTQPLTSYNMVVLDQNLGDGSYISLVNTNVIKSGPKTGTNYTANVTAADIRYIDHSKTYSISAVPSVSQKYFSGSPDIFGYSLMVSGGKTGGAFRLYARHQSISKSYDPNDMGYLKHNNIMVNSISTGYNIYKPKGSVLSSMNSVTFTYESLFEPREFTSFNISLSSKTTLKDLSVISISSSYQPTESHDYYEPRNAGRYYSRPANIAIGAGYFTDTRKTVSATIYGEIQYFLNKSDMFRYRLSTTPVIRLNNRFVLSYTLSAESLVNDFGYVTIEGTGEIIFGNRRSGTIENTPEISYIFSPRSYLNMRIRHYWSKVDYSAQCYTLQEDGSLLANQDVNYEPDININYFNIDLEYTWRFAPGSELSLFWKNSIYSSGDEVFRSFSDNFRSMIDSRAINGFSLKILYYLDYQAVRKMF